MRPRPRAGDRGRVICTLPYAPPEAVNAHFAKTELTVHPSLDIWAVGVVMFEALTGAPAFPRFCGADTIAACAAGEAAYPWEGGADEVPRAWTHARMYPIIAPCLSRDLERRPSAPELMRAFRRLEHMTTIGDA